MGRLSLNPVVHADPMGTILLPIFFTVIGGVTFGYAKPVPVQPSRFKNIKWGVFWVSFAGPMANILLCVLSSLFFVLAAIYLPESFTFKSVLIGMLRYSISINMLLAVFNLIPLPPLDGGQMAQTLMSYENARRFAELQRYTFVILIVLMMTGVFETLFFGPARMIANILIQVFYTIFAGALF